MGAPTVFVRCTDVIILSVSVWSTFFLVQMQTMFSIELPKAEARLREAINTEHVCTRNGLFEEIGTMHELTRRRWLAETGMGHGYTQSG